MNILRIPWISDPDTVQWEIFLFGHPWAHYFLIFAECTRCNSCNGTFVRVSTIIMCKKMIPNFFIFPMMMDKFGTIYSSKATATTMAYNNERRQQQTTQQEDW